MTPSAIVINPPAHPIKRENRIQCGGVFSNYHDTPQFMLIVAGKSNPLKIHEIMPDTVINC